MAIFRYLHHGPKLLIGFAGRLSSSTCMPVTLSLPWWPRVSRVSTILTGQSSYGTTGMLRQTTALFARQTPGLSMAMSISATLSGEFVHYYLRAVLLLGETPRRIVALSSHR